MAGAIERAFIEILADASGFDRSLTPNVRRAARRAGRGLTAEFADASNDVRNRINQMVNHLNNRFASVNSDRLARNLRDIEKQLADVGIRGSSHLDNLRQSIIRLDNAIIRGPKDTLNDLRQVTERFAARFRAALGRSALAGPQNLNRSLKDVERTLRRELPIAAENANTVLTRLARIQGLDRLSPEFLRLSKILRDDIGNAARIATREMEVLRNRGNLTREAYERAISRIARDFDTRFTAATQRAERAVLQLSGSSSGFSRLQGQILHSAQTMDRLGQSIGSGARSFTRIRTAGQTTMALLSQRVAETTTRVGNLTAGLRALDQNSTRARLMAQRVKEVGDRARESAVRVRALEPAFNRAAAGAQRLSKHRMVGLLADLNRARFAVLNLRIAFSLLGGFLAQRFARFGIEAAKNLELLELSLQTIAMSIEGLPGQSVSDFADQAEVSFKRIIRVARETPFSIESVAEATRRLVAVVPSLGLIEDGFDSLTNRTDAALDLFETFGGALALLGQSGDDSLERLTIALGQIGSRAQLTGRDVLRLSRLLPGIPIEQTIIDGLALTEGFEDLNREIGYTGDNADQAIANFLNMRMRGLIPAEAAVLGLKEGIDNLFDTEQALRDFTRTIEGSMEKIREASEIGVTRGLEPLSRILFEGLPSSMAIVEQASERFGRGLSDLAQGALPIFFRSLSGLADLFADLSSAAGGFFSEFRLDTFDIFSNFNQVLRGLGATLGEIIGSITPAVRGITDVLASIAEGFAQVARVASPVMASIGRTVGDLLSLMSKLPGVINIGIVGAMIALRHQFTLAAATSLKTIGGTMLAQFGRLETAKIAAGNAMIRLAKLLKTAGIFAVIAGGIVIIDKLRDAFFGAEQAIEDFQREIDIEFPFDDAVSGVENLGRSLVDLNSTLRVNRPQVESLADEFQRIAGRDYNNLGTFRQLLERNIPPLGENNRRTRELANELHRLERETLGAGAAQRVQNRIMDRFQRDVLPQAALSLGLLSDAFDSSAISAGLSREEFALIIDDVAPEFAGAFDGVRGALAEGRDGSEELEEALRILRAGFTDAGGDGIDFIGILQRAGIPLSNFAESLGKPIRSFEELSEKARIAGDSVREFIDIQRAAVDPVFALVRANDGLIDAKQAVVDALEAEEPNQRDIERAYQDQVRAVMDLEGAQSEMIEKVLEGNTSFSEARDVIERMVEQYGLGSEVLEIFDGKIADLRPQLEETLRRALPEATDAALRALMVLVEDGSEAFDILARDAEGAVDLTSEAFKSLPPEIQAEIVKINQSIKNNQVDDLADDTDETVTRTNTSIARLTPFFSDVLQATQREADGFRSPFRTSMEGTATEGVGKFVINAFKLPSFLSPLGTLLNSRGAGAGGSFMDGLRAGMSDKVRSLVTAALRIGSLIGRTVRSAMNSNSPSKVAIAIGQDFLKGLELGLMKTDALELAARGAATAISASAAGAVLPPGTPGTMGFGTASSRPSIEMTVIAPDPITAGRKATQNLRDVALLYGDF